MTLTNLFRLDGKNAVVTGGSRGLGWAIAKGLSDAGARVMIIDQRPVSSAQLAKLSNGEKTGTTLQVDLSEKEGQRLAIKTALSTLNDRVDILVNNAGIQHRAQFSDYPRQAWDEVIELNLTVPFVLSQGFSYGMIQRKSGKIINIASIRSFIGSERAVAYSASKGGLLQLTRSLSNDLSPDGIQVNAIAPGFMDTDMTIDLKSSPKLRHSLLSRIPVGRLGQPEDIVGTAIFLASPASDYVTGATIPCDGGFLSA